MELASHCYRVVQSKLSPKDNKDYSLLVITMLSTKRIVNFSILLSTTALYAKGSPSPENSFIKYSSQDTATLKMKLELQLVNSTVSGSLSLYLNIEIEKIIYKIEETDYIDK